MQPRSKTPSLDRRCRACDSPLSDAGFFTRLLANWSAQLCSRCRTDASASRPPVVLATTEERDPFSLFMREDALDPPQPAEPALAEREDKRIRVRPAAAPARSLILAFGLGLAGGAAPLWWQDVLRSGESSTWFAGTDTEAREIAAASRGGRPTPREAAPVLPPSGVAPRLVLAADISLPSSPAESVRDADTRPKTTRPPAAPARPRVRAIRYPGRVRATFRGSLAVNSTPAGARVSLDGMALGSTPIRIDGVPAGSHVLRLEAEGRRVSASAIQVVADRTTRVTRALERTP